MFEIEKGISMPLNGGRGAPVKYTFLYDMEVGDSVLVYGKKPSNFGPIFIRHRPKKFSSKLVDGANCRIWRTA